MDMNDNKLRDKLRKLEALYAKTQFEGEKEVASEAIQRLKEKLREYQSQEVLREYKFSITERWSRHLFIALCRRYSIKPYRYYRQKRSSIMVKAPKRFIDEVLYPEFNALDHELFLHISKITMDIIKTEIYDDTSEILELED